MSNWIKWAVRTAAAVAALIAMVVAGVGVTSEAMVRWPGPRSVVDISASHDAGAVDRGSLVAERFGCTNCHGADLAGQLFFDQMPLARIWAPNLTLAAAEQSDADLARAIRDGVAADGHTLWIMPSDAFSRLSPQETADLVAFIRSKPVMGLRQPAKQMGVVGRVGVMLGKFKSAPQLIAANRAVASADLGPAYARGRDLARTCMECHGLDLKGSEAVHAPDLTVAAAYTFDDFDRLMRTGVAAGDRRLGLMSEIAPARFSRLSNREMIDLHDYLKARAGFAG